MHNPQSDLVMRFRCSQADRSLRANALLHPRAFFHFFDSPSSSTIHTIFPSYFGPLATRSVRLLWLRVFSARSVPYNTYNHFDYYFKNGFSRQPLRKRGEFNAHPVNFPCRFLVSYFSMARPWPCFADTRSALLLCYLPIPESQFFFAPYFQHLRCHPPFV